MTTTPTRTATSVATATALSCLVRIIGIALGFVAFDWSYDQTVPSTPADADIGKGLLAFFLLGVACLTWAFVDGIRLPRLTTVTAWIVTSLAIALGWELVLGGNTGTQFDPGSVLFTVQLLLVPALVGAGLGWLVRGARPQRDPFG